LEELHAEVVSKLESSQAANAGWITASPVDSTESQPSATEGWEEFQRATSSNYQRLNESDALQQEQAGGYALANNINVVDRIDRWGFWGLTGY
jgi:hypothetical protein